MSALNFCSMMFPSSQDPPGVCLSLGRFCVPSLREIIGRFSFVACHNGRTKMVTGLLVVSRAAFGVTSKFAPASKISIRAGKGICPTSHVQKAPRVKLSVSRGFFKSPRPARPACRLARKIGRSTATCHHGNIVSLTSDVLGQQAVCSGAVGAKRPVTLRVVCLGL